MKGWFQRFMSGRYGFDQFGGFLCIASFILIVIGAWVSPILYWLGLAGHHLQLLPHSQPQHPQALCRKSQILILPKPRNDLAGQVSGAVQAAQGLPLLPLPQVRSAAARAPWARQNQHHRPKCGNQFIKKS